jgi:hypothetical protein
LWGEWIAIELSMATTAKVLEFGAPDRIATSSVESAAVALSWLWNYAKLLQHAKLIKDAPIRDDLSIHES